MGGTGPGPRVFFPTRRHRWHHALFGFVMMGVGVGQHSAALMIGGAAVVLHDWPDKRYWLSDLVYCREVAR